MSAFFITASGTGVGKTLVTATLAWQLGQQGRPVIALKPIVTGFDPAYIAQSDTGRILQSLGRELTMQEVNRISPCRFSAPISPDMAAAREGKEIDFGELFAFCDDAIANARDEGAVLLIEGIGGVMVPLTENQTVADWMAAIGLPAILVTGSYLGSLSHTLTALETMAARGIKTAAVVVSESPENPVPFEETMETIRRFVEPALVRPIPRLDDVEMPWEVAPDLTDIVAVDV